MAFNSLPFAVFFAIVCGLMALTSGKRIQALLPWPVSEVRHVLLLLASYVFYGWWNWKCCFLMLGLTVVAYGCAAAYEKDGRKLWVTLGVVVPLVILGIFKYFNFFVDSFCALFGIARAGSLNILLPVGISFYTFQSLSYTIDVYRGKVRAEKSFVNVALYIAFFPQLVAGPIERGHKLLPQFAARRRFDEAEATDGMRLLLWGLVKKMLIADNCATQVDYIFANYQDVSTPTLWLGALYFTFQIYGDFSGYSDMAVGSAKLLGIRISANFDKPYFATSLPEFWRRWHITLMGWFRDYVYIPLGGNRRGPARQTANRFAVFLLSGLWHGSNWTFVLWGLYHALCYRLPARRLTFLVVLLGWVIFRAEDATMAAGYLSGMFCPRMLSSVACSRMPLLPIALLVVAEWLMRSAPHPFQWRNTGWQSHQWVRLAVYLLVFSVTVLAGGATVQFIYFQF